MRVILGISKSLYYQKDFLALSQDYLALKVHYGHVKNAKDLEK